MGTNLPRILIVDDEPAIQRFLKTALSSEEFALHQAATGHDALAAAVRRAVQARIPQPVAVALVNMNGDRLGADGDISPWQ